MPDQASPTVVPPWKPLLCLAPAVLLYAAFWLQPVPSHVTAAAAFLDGLTAWASGVLIVTVIAALFRIPGRLAVVRVAAITSTVPALATLAVLSGVPKVEVLFPIVAVLSLLLSLYCLHLLGVTRAGTGEVFRKRLLAVTAATAVPLFAFWQQASYLPSQNQASLVVMQSATLQTDPDGGKHWVVKVTAENKAPTRAVVIISTTEVCHWKSEKERNASSADPLDLPNCHRLADPFGESDLDAGGSLTHVDSTPASIALPYVEVVVRVAVARGDRFRRISGGNRNIPLADRERCKSLFTATLQDDTRYKTLVGGSDYFSFFTRAGGIRNFAIGQDPLATCPSEGEYFRDDRLDEYYGISESRQFWVGWIMPPGTMTAAS